MPNTRHFPIGCAALPSHLEIERAGGSQGSQDTHLLRSTRMPVNPQAKTSVETEEEVISNGGG